MWRRVSSFLIGLVAFSLFLSGCFLNTPDHVVKRFVAHMRGMRWDRMAELVDWPESSKYVPDVPASNEGEKESKKEVMLRIAENLSGFPVRRKTADQVQHEFLYLRISRLEHTKEGEDWVWLKVEVVTEARSKTVDMLVMKINRIWRVVLTESIFE